MLKSKVGDIDILIETDEVEGVRQTSSFIEKVQEKTGQVFSTAVQSIFGIAAILQDEVSKLEEGKKPEKLTIELGIKFNVEGQIIIAKTSSDSSLKVSMTFDN